MSDEEKKALEILKDREYDFDELYCTFRQSFIKPYDKSIGIILELIEKQSKEIEELKANKGYHLGFIDGGLAKKYEYQDKIKAKIEELDYNDIGNFERRCKQEVLQSLLEKE